MKSFVFLALLAATPALADCPTGDDLAGGIRVVESDGTTHIYRDVGKGVVQADITYAAGGVSRNLLAQGSHVLQLASVEDGSIVPDSISNIAYPARAPDLPIPTANSVWTVKTTVNAFGDIYPETQTQAWGDTFTLTIGTCSFDAIEGAVEYVTQDNTTEETIYFIPDLGIGLLQAYGDSALEREVYTFTQIAVAQ